VLSGAERRNICSFIVDYQQKGAAHRDNKELAINITVRCTSWVINILLATNI
jgi:hypothetical protein